MVVALGPSRFYGGVLPRPRVFPDDRVDPPAPVTDALLCWARDAHWSMGGLGAKRLRLQGRIEGNLVKLRRTTRHDARVSPKSAKSKAMRWEEVEVGEPGDGEIQIWNTAIGVNFIDVYFRKFNSYYATFSSPAVGRKRQNAGSAAGHERQASL